MKVGDLVRYWSDDEEPRRSGPGIIIDFDRDADPIVWFVNAPEQPAAYFRADMEVISGSQSR